MYQRYAATFSLLVNRAQDVSVIDVYAINEISTVNIFQGWLDGGIQENTDYTANFPVVFESRFAINSPNTRNHWRQNQDSFIQLRK
ncbi:unnamed protein product [Allacma fusca]|uniref:Uncharacterized protein n=1 Tax=Allacma fusca TaxID=39272 RepID=A0A8J2KNM3_9HEXA|nr:unnamed protein product [Allacma fusca]